LDISCKYGQFNNYPPWFNVHLADKGIVEITLNHPEVRKLIDNEQFDLVLLVPTFGQLDITYSLGISKPDNYNWPRPFETRNG